MQNLVVYDNLASEKLTERRRRILNIVIQEYVQNAQPVGSQVIAQNYDLGVSSATIRNDLSALEEEGMLTHPHTSAGRVPTEAGYRYFVHHLLTESELPFEDRRAIRVQFRQVRRELEQYLRLSTAVLSKTAQSAAVATAPRAQQTRFKHIELVGIHDTKVLLVLVLQDGTVKQQVLDLDQPMAQDLLRQVSNELNAHLANADAESIFNKYNLLTPFAVQVAMLVKEIFDRLESNFNGQIYRDGLAHMLEAPEFAGGEGVGNIVRVFEQRTLLEQVLGEYEGGNDIQVVIAGEGRFAELQDISLVLGRYGMSNRATGLVGVIGPLRMPYSRTISAVRYVSELMSEMVEELYTE